MRPGNNIGEYYDLDKDLWIKLPKMNGVYTWHPDIKFMDEGNNVLMVAGGHYEYGGDVEDMWGIVETLDLREDNQQWSVYEKENKNFVLNKGFFGLKCVDFNMRGLFSL